MSTMQHFLVLWSCTGGFSFYFHVSFTLIHYSESKFARNRAFLMGNSVYLVNILSPVLAWIPNTQPRKRQQRGTPCGGSNVWIVYSNFALCIARFVHSLSFPKDHLDWTKL
uniref:Uncharacterized protein n=1 Tax=Anopheles braziliensis TaxID=58242 RepID=A0A2M3ZLT2_9DIPT